MKLLTKKGEAAIRLAALEEAARECDLMQKEDGRDCYYDGASPEMCAERIRDLKEKK